MRRKTMTAVLAAIMIVAATGCNTSTVTMLPPAEDQTGPSGAKAVANLEAENWGLFLFYGIPLWSGHSGSPNRREYVIFGNRVRPKDMDMMLRQRAKALKAGDVEDVKIKESSTGFFSLWILWRRNISATAVAVEKK